jgi:sulfite reductase (NADPH) flavoprotein alpha-component
LLPRLGRLQPRLYSIASSLRAHRDEAHLTVGVVRYERKDRMRKGVASTFFADRLQPGGTVRVYVQPAYHFRLPHSPDTPLIMVGPGTGIAPFRAFLQERRAIGARGKTWLFFGNPHGATDFLYRDELEGFLREGALARLDTAFSRDQRDKIYVQHRMLEHAREIWAWLEDGAHLYVCGDASKMAQDVHAALHRIAVQTGRMSEDQATAFMRGLADAGRYQRDVY